jgi:hypothetical protein
MCICRQGICGFAVCLHMPHVHLEVARDVSQGYVPLSAAAAQLLRPSSASETLYRVLRMHAMYVVHVCWWSLVNRVVTCLAPARTYKHSARRTIVAHACIQPRRSRIS